MFARNINDMTGAGKQDHFRTISAKQAKEIMNTEKDCVILDVCTAEEPYGGCKVNSG